MSRDVELPQAHTVEPKFEFTLGLSWLILTLVRYLVMATLKQRKRAKKLADERRVVPFCFQYQARSVIPSLCLNPQLACIVYKGKMILDF